MWTIRQEQTETFRQHHLQKFEDEMVEHLKEFAPQRCRVAGETSVRRVIRMGLANAANYGLTNRGPARLYIELMFMFGSYFDSDPQYAWARAAISGDADDQTEKADRLFKSMENYLARAARLAADPVDVLLTFERLRNEQWMMPGETREHCSMRLIQALYPRKCESISERDLQTIVSNAARIAPEHGFEGVRDFTVLIALMLILGQVFVKDPLCPWMRSGTTGALGKKTSLKSDALAYLVEIQPDIKRYVE